MASRLACLPLMLLFASRLGVTACEPDIGKTEKSSAQQKIVLLERMISSSEPAQRVMNIGSESAKALLDKARNEAADARTLFGQDCYEEASRLAAQGLATASTAFRGAASPDAAEVDEYERLLRQTRSLLDTIEKQGEAVSGLDAATLGGMQRQLARAEQLALVGQHDSASSLLVPIADRLERRLFDVFDRQTLTYARTHSSPAEEYAYLAENYRGYRLLLESHRPSQAGIRGNEAAVAALLSDAESLVKLAEAEKSRERWAEAISALQQAIEHCERASRISGLQF
jgi:hypothetical protein